MPKSRFDSRPAAPLLAAFLVLLHFVEPVSAGSAPEWPVDDEVLPLVNQSGDRYGYTATLEGRWLAVGAPLRSPGGCSSCGEVSLYRRDPAGEWVEMDTLQPSGVGSGHNYGYHLDFDGRGERLAVSAYLEDGGRGAVYVYVFDPDAQTWSEEQRIVPIDTDDARVFGQVSIDGERLIVGAARDDEAGADAGAAYIFERDLVLGDWTQTRKILAPDAAAGDLFGVAVAISGDHALVGAYFENENGFHAGAAYVFERDLGGAGNWGFAEKLLASNGAADDLFGTFLALEGDVAVVGAFVRDQPFSDTGAAYVFERDHPTAGAWGERIALSPADANAGMTFGRQVAIDGDRIAIGAAGSDQGFSDSGGVYLYERDLGGANAWGLAGTAAPASGVPGQCGHGAAIDGPFASCGHPFDAGGVNRATAFVDPAWVFSDGFEALALGYWSSSLP